MRFSYIAVEASKNCRKFISKLKDIVGAALVIISRKDPQICNKH